MTHDELVLRACRWLRSARKCHPVFAEFQRTDSMEIPDAIGWTTSGVVHVVEAKVTRADFLSDEKKWHARSGDSMGHRRWYVAPKDLIRTVELGEAGLLEPSGRGLRIVSRPLSRRMSQRARREAFAILRNALRRHEIGVAWDPATFRFARIRG